GARASWPVIFASRPGRTIHSCVRKASSICKIFCSGQASRRSAMLIRITSTQRLPRRPWCNACCRTSYSLSLRERARVRGPMKGGLTQEYLAFVRQLRRNQTDAEKLLWYSLRHRQLCGLKFRRQYPVGSYVLDFYCHEYRLCIELDGDQHYESAGTQHDTQRQAFLASHGIHTLRFSNREVLQNLEGVLLQIVEAVKPLTPTLWRDCVGAGRSPSRRERE